MSQCCCSDDGWRMSLHSHGKWPLMPGCKICDLVQTRPVTKLDTTSLAATKSEEGLGVGG